MSRRGLRGFGAGGAGIEGVGVGDQGCAESRSKMGSAAPTTLTIESEKRRQIIDGARDVFLAQGFDAASMSDIARKAGVSKGTLYVYFDSKEALFQAIAHEQCHAQAEQIFALDHGDHDVE